VVRPGAAVGRSVGLVGIHTSVRTREWCAWGRAPPAAAAGHVQSRTYARTPIEMPMSMYKTCLLVRFRWTCLWLKNSSGYPYKLLMDLTVVEK
jgi:hypothetical protein